MPEAGAAIILLLQAETNILVNYGRLWAYRGKQGQG